MRRRSQGSDLPILREEYVRKIVEFVDNFPLVIITGETGCGKSTQVPQLLVDELNARKVIITCPTRISARSISTWVAKCRGKNVGGEVGYSTGDDKKKSEMTRIEFQTVGVLKEIFLGRQKNRNKKNGNFLHREATHIIIDEVHERGIDIDTVLFFLKKFFSNTNNNNKKEDDLRVILMSATISHKQFVKYFENVPRIRRIPHINVPTRNFPVEVRFLHNVIDLVGRGNIPPRAQNEDFLGRKNFNRLNARLLDDVQDVAIELISVLHHKRREYENFAFLVFLPGISEITMFQNRLMNKNCLPMDEVEIHILHSSVSKEAQDEIFIDTRRRKIILSTNIAESSITIQEVKVVIDFCLFKEMNINFHNGAEELKLKWASQESMTQRKGRAGRVQAGVCFRMIPDYFYRRLNVGITPEIQRTSLSHLILKFLNTNVKYPEKMFEQFISPPVLKNVKKAYDDLEEEHCVRLSRISTSPSLLQKQQQQQQQNYYYRKVITKKGRFIVDFPLNLKNANLLYLGLCFGYLNECIVISSILDVGGISFRGSRSPLSQLRKQFENAKSWKSDVIASYLVFHEYWSMCIQEYESKQRRHRGRRGRDDNGGNNVHDYRRIEDRKRKFCIDRGLSIKKLNEVKNKIKVLVMDKMFRKYPNLRNLIIDHSLEISEQEEQEEVEGEEENGRRRMNKSTSSSSSRTKLGGRRFFRLEEFFRFRSNTRKLHYLELLICISYLSNTVILSNKHHETLKKLPKNFDKNSSVELILDQKIHDPKRTEFEISQFIDSTNPESFDGGFGSISKKSFITLSSKHEEVLVENGIYCEPGQKEAYVQFENNSNHNQDNNDNDNSQLPIQLITKFTNHQFKRLLFNPGRGGRFGDDVKMPYKEAKGPIKLYFKGLFYSEKMMVSRFSILDNYITPQEFTSHQLQKDYRFVFTSYTVVPDQNTIYLDNCQLGDSDPGLIDLFFLCFANKIQKSEAKQGYVEVMMNNNSYYFKPVLRSVQIVKNINMIRKYVNETVIDKFILDTKSELHKIRRTQQRVELMFLKLMNLYTNEHRNYWGDIYSKIIDEQKDAPKGSYFRSSSYGKQQKRFETRLKIHNEIQTGHEFFRKLSFVRRREKEDKSVIERIVTNIMFFLPSFHSSTVYLLIFIFQSKMNSKFGSFFFEMCKEIRKGFSFTFFFRKESGVSMNRIEPGKRKLCVSNNSSNKRIRVMISETNILFSKLISRMIESYSFVEKRLDNGRVFLVPKYGLCVLPFTITPENELKVMFFKNSDDDDDDDGGYMNSKFNLPFIDRNFNSSTIVDNVIKELSKKIYNKFFTKKRGKIEMSKYCTHHKHLFKVFRKNSNFDFCCFPVPYMEKEEMRLKGVFDCHFLDFFDERMMMMKNLNCFHLFYDQIISHFSEFQGHVYPKFQMSKVQRNQRFIRRIREEGMKIYSNDDDDECEFIVFGIRFPGDEKSNLVEYRSEEMSMFRFRSVVVNEIMEKCLSLHQVKIKKMSSIRKRKKKAMMMLPNMKIIIRFQIIQYERNYLSIRRLFGSIYKLMMNHLLLKNNRIMKLEIRKDKYPFYQVDFRLVKKDSSSLEFLCIQNILLYMGDSELSHQKVIQSSLWCELVYQNVVAPKMWDRDTWQKSKTGVHRISLELLDDDEEKSGSSSRGARRGGVGRPGKGEDREAQTNVRIVSGQYSVVIEEIELRKTYLPNMIHRVLREMHRYPNEVCRNFELRIDINLPRSKKIRNKNRKNYMDLVVGKRFNHYFNHSKLIDIQFDFSGRNKRFFACVIRMKFSSEVERNMFQNEERRRKRMRTDEIEREEINLVDEMKRREEHARKVENMKKQMMKRRERIMLEKKKKVRNMSSSSGGSSSSSSSTHTTPSPNRTSGSNVRSNVRSSQPSKLPPKSSNINNKSNLDAIDLFEIANIESGFTMIASRDRDKYREDYRLKNTTISRSRGRGRRRRMNHSSNISREKNQRIDEKRNEKRNVIQRNNRTEKNEKKGYYDEEEERERWRRRDREDRQEQKSVDDNRRRDDRSGRKEEQEEKRRDRPKGSDRDRPSQGHRETREEEGRRARVEEEKVPPRREERDHQNREEKGVSRKSKSSTEPKMERKQENNPTNNVQNKKQKILVILEESDDEGEKDEVDEKNQKEETITQRTRSSETREEEKVNEKPDPNSDRNQNKKEQQQKGKEEEEENDFEFHDMLDKFRYERTKTEQKPSYHHHNDQHHPSKKENDQKILLSDLKINETHPEEKIESSKQSSSSENHKNRSKKEKVKLDDVSNHQNQNIKKLPKKESKELVKQEKQSDEKKSSEKLDDRSETPILETDESSSSEHEKEEEKENHRTINTKVKDEDFFTIFQQQKVRIENEQKKKKENERKEENEEDNFERSETPILETDEDPTTSEEEEKVEKEEEQPKEEMKMETKEQTSNLPKTQEKDDIDEFFDSDDVLVEDDDDDDDEYEDEEEEEEIEDKSEDKEENIPIKEEKEEEEPQYFDLDDDDDDEEENEYFKDEDEDIIIDYDSENILCSDSEDENPKRSNRENSKESEPKQQQQMKKEKIKQNDEEMKKKKDSIFLSEEEEELESEGEEILTFEFFSTKRKLSNDDDEVKKKSKIITHKRRKKEDIDFDEVEEYFFQDFVDDDDRSVSISNSINKNKKIKKSSQKKKKKKMMKYRIHNNHNKTKKWKKYGTRDDGEEDSDSVSIDSEEEMNLFQDYAVNLPSPMNAYIKKTRNSSKRKKKKSSSKSSDLKKQKIPKHQEKKKEKSSSLIISSDDDTEEDEDEESVENFVYFDDDSD